MGEFFVKASGDASEVLDFGKEAFHEVSVFVEDGIKVLVGSLIAPMGEDGFCPDAADCFKELWLDRAPIRQDIIGLLPV